MRDDERTALGSPPLARGAPRRRPRRRGRRGITPARAGSTRWVAPLRCSSGDHPRSRGEHLDVARARAAIRGSPPLARGAPRHRHAAWLRDGITPARAGSTSPGSGRTGRSWDHPRSRGEHGQVARCARGAHGITPARAGSTVGFSSRRAGRWDHPRSRGEHNDILTGEAGVEGSPPLARGAHAADHRRDRDRGITPARAGSTNEHLLSKSLLRDHPRSRGEHPGEGVSGELGQGSPPLARGAHRLLPQEQRGAGITPARAGSTRGGW